MVVEGDAAAEVGLVIASISSNKQTQKTAGTVEHKGNGASVPDISRWVKCMY